jgi:hypothetical protein
MASHTKQSLEYFKWVLNRIQTSRALDSVAGIDHVTYVYGSENNDPPEPEQHQILKELEDRGVITVLKTAYKNIISTKDGREIPYIKDNAADLSSHNIFPYSRELRIKRNKFDAIVLKYEILANRDYIKYEFDSNRMEGILRLGKKEPIFFTGSRSLVIQFFYEHRNDLKQEYDFEIFQKYTVNNIDEKIKHSKVLNNKEFRERISEINERVENETKSISGIILKLEVGKMTRRNNYKWEILFKTI